MERDFIKERNLTGLDAKAEQLREKYKDYIEDDKPVCHYYWGYTNSDLGASTFNFYPDAPESFKTDIIALANSQKE